MSKGRSKVRVKKGECFKFHQKGQWKKNFPLLKSQNIDKQNNIASSSASVTSKTSGDENLVVLVMVGDNYLVNNNQILDSACSSYYTTQSEFCFRRQSYLQDCEAMNSKDIDI